MYIIYVRDCIALVDDSFYFILYIKRRAEKRREEKRREEACVFLFDRTRRCGHMDSPLLGTAQLCLT